MAKNGKKSKKGDKGDKAKLPKTVAGVKIPKSLRMQGDTISALITSPVARELLADVLIAVAGVLAGNKRSREAIAQAGSAAADAGASAASGAKDFAQTATGALAEVVTDAARQILPTALVGEGADQREPSKQGGDRPRPAAANEGGRARKKKDQETDESRPGFIE